MIPRSKTDDVPLLYTYTSIVIIAENWPTRGCKGDMISSASESSSYRQCYHPRSWICLEVHKYSLLLPKLLSF